MTEARSEPLMLAKDRERLVKLLGMTHSASDGEALAAIRKCNELLRQHKLSWNDVVAQDRSSRPQRTLREDPNPFTRAAGTARASSSRAFDASIRREKYLEKVRRSEKSVALQVRIDRVPVLLRLAFFPLWAAAAMLAKVVIPEVSTPLRAFKLAGTTLVVVACGATWWQIVDVAVSLFQDLDSVPPMDLQAIADWAGGLSAPLFAPRARSPVGGARYARIMLFTVRRLLLHAQYVARHSEYPTLGDGWRPGSAGRRRRVHRRTDP